MLAAPGVAMATGLAAGATYHHVTVVDMAKGDDGTRDCGVMKHDKTSKSAAAAGSSLSSSSSVAPSKKITAVVVVGGKFAVAANSDPPPETATLTRRSGSPAAAARVHQPTRQRRQEGS